MLYADRLERRVTTEFYDAKRAEIELELERIQEGMRLHSEADKKYFELGINLFDLSQQAPDIFLQTEPERKRKLLTLICQEMYTIDGRLVVRFTDLFYTLSQLAEALNRSEQHNSAPSPFEIFELQKSPYFDLQNGAEVPQNDALLAWWSFFRTGKLLKLITDPDAFGEMVGELLLREATQRSDPATLFPPAF